MVAIVKDIGKLKTSQVTQEKTIKAKKVTAPESDDDDDDSSSEEEIKIDLKKATVTKSAPTPVKQPVKVIKKEESESDSDDDDDDEDDESEEETKVKPVQKTVDIKKKVPVKQESDDDDEEEEEKLVIHPKNGVNNRNNGFNKPGANSKEDEIINEKLKEIATDVKSNEAAEKGDFKLFNLPSNLIEKLKAKKITYLYPIQIATLTHIRAGHDVIAQASKSSLK